MAGEVRVLQVIARMNVGGTARYVGKLVQEIPNTLLATGYVQGAELEDGCVAELQVARVKHLGRAINPVADLRAYFQLWSIIRRYQPAVIHSHTFKAGLLVRLIPTKARRIHTFHGHLFEDSSFSNSQKRVILWVERWLANRAAVLISVGERVGQELRRMKIGAKAKWVSIAPGVDSLPSHDRKQARAELGLPDSMADWLLVGWLARMAPVKNPFLLFEVARAWPQVQFVMAGGGQMLDSVRAAAPANVLVLGWAQAELFWSAVDIAISTSDNEGMPVALIEAQLAGLPVVATDAGANGEVVQDGQTGFVVPVGDSPALAGALSRLVASAGLRESMGQAAKVRAQQEFTSSLMIARHLAIYE